MSTVTLKVRLSIDGRPLAGMPLSLSKEIAGPLQGSLYNLAAAAASADIATPDVLSHVLVAVMPLSYGPVSARFGAQATGGVETRRRGLILAFNVAATVALPRVANDHLTKVSSVLVQGAQEAAV